MSKIAAIPLAAVMFAVWAVYLGGLAAIQAECSDNGDANLPGVPRIDPALPCHKVYRLYWFYASWEIFVIVMIAVVAVTGRLVHGSGALVGLLAVALMMFIDTSDTFLTAEDQDAYTSGQPVHRIRTITAGAIMTALMNGVAILVVGYTEWFGVGHHHHTHIDNKPTTTVVQTA